MSGHAVKPRRHQGRVAVKKAMPDPDEDSGAKILVLTDDPHRNVVIVPGCQLNSMRGDQNAFFFEDGNALVGMIINGGSVEYRREDRTYIVRLTKGYHAE